MAVLQMQRISICALKHDRKAILEKLQSMGMIEMHQVAQDEAGFEKMDTQSAKSSFEKRVQITENALDVLNQYTPEKKSMFASLEGNELIDKKTMEAAAAKQEAVMEVAGLERKGCKNLLIRLAVKARGSEVQKTMAKYTKRRDKRGYEWKSAYREKEALMLERGYPEVSPHDFYRELFPAGSLQQEPEDGKGNIIATQIRPSGKGRTRQWVIDDSLKMLDKVVGDRFGLIPPISFYGKSHTKENAHELFAVVVDVDYVGKQQLKNLLKQFGNGVQLRPTYLVSSGKGVHLYYFLQEPVQLYRNREEVLAELKEAFIRRLWNDTSSIRPDSPDITGIYQGFRCVGSQSKLGADFPVKAYKLSENRYTLEDIKASIPSCKVDLAPLYEKPRRKSTVTLEEAKELYPEWYEKRIVQGEPKQQSKKQGGTWVCNEALYEWWKRKITEEVKAGGRYFSIMALCSYGLKCGISEQKIRRDAYAFLDHLESLTEDEDNHFSRADVKDALRALKGDRKRLSTIASREWIEDNTKVTIPANKRNYRKQEAHLYLARRKKEDMKVIGEVVKEGRPTAERTVREWQESHPTGKKADCIRETGLAKHTVYKWWKDINNENI